MRIKELTLVLENCDVITIDGKYIGEFGIDKIKEKFHRIGINAISRYKECEVFYVEIHKDGNDKYSPFEKTFDRIMEYPDITHVEVKYENEKGKTKLYKYSVKWDSENSISNRLQDTDIGASGSLFIKIGKKSLEKYFSPGALESKDWNWS